jgi:hypothetical protein
MGVKRVEVAVLRSVCDQIFRFITDDLKVTSVDLDGHLYWTLPNEARFDMTRTPMVEHVGDMADDYDFVKAAAQDPDQAVPLLLEHIAPLLYALSTAVPSYTQPAAE